LVIATGSKIRSSIIFWFEKAINETMAVAITIIIVILMMDGKLMIIRDGIFRF